jgi:hypothetical protein
VLSRDFSLRLNVEEEEEEEEEEYMMKFRLLKRKVRSEWN